MNRIVFFFLYLKISFFSKLPFWVLHRLSDFLYLVLFYIIQYRKKKVLENLKYAFPKKNTKALKKIRRHFYKFFADFIMEQIKSFSISEKTLQKRFRYKNIEIFEEVAALNKSCIVIGGHYCNWEWVCDLPKNAGMNCIGTYNKFSNIYFEKWIKKNRERFGVKFLRTSETIDFMRENTSENKNYVYGLLSDQSPILEKTFYWRSFLNVEVPVHTGAEMLAKKYDCCVLFIGIKRTKRSTYEAKFEWLAKNAKDFKDYQITDLFLEQLEKIIEKEPSYYLWTHNRFKHKNKKHLWKNLK